MEKTINQTSPLLPEPSPETAGRNRGTERLSSDFLRSLYRRHRQGAFVRSGGALFMWVIAVAAFWIDDVKSNHFWGVSGAVAYLILINPPTLYALKRISTGTALKFLSLLINFLEIAGYTAVMYFLGGIEAVYLTPIYGIVISYVGIVAPQRYPFFVAGFCALCFILMVWAQLWGWLPPQSVSPSFDLPLKRQMVTLFVVLGLLFLTAFAASYTSRLLKKHRDRVLKQNEELEMKVAQRTVDLRNLNEQLQEELLRRQEMEKDLKASEEKYRCLFENSFDVIYAIDTQANIVSVSPSVKMALGYEPEELIGKSIAGLNIIAPESMEFAYKNALRVFAGETIQAVEYQFIDRQGNRKYAEISGAPLVQDGKVTGLISIGRDITERKQAEAERNRAWEELERRVQDRTRDLARARQEAEAANRAKSEFLANMSHELRTPLNAIIGFSEILLDRHLGELNQEQAEYIGDIATSGQHLLSLINDILDLSKIESGKMELALAPVSLDNVLQRGLTIVKEKAAKHRIQLSCTTDGAPQTILADERKIKQIIFNLLGNAVKFTPDGGRVSIGVRTLSPEAALTVGKWGIGMHPGDESCRAESFLLLHVADTGIGIKTKDLERIFQPFEQGDNSSTKFYQGTGLGLTLSRSFAEVHGGKVWAESEGLGKGSTFYFLFPLWTPDAALPSG